MKCFPYVCTGKPYVCNIFRPRALINVTTFTRLLKICIVWLHYVQWCIQRGGAQGAGAPPLARGIQLVATQISKLISIASHKPLLGDKNAMSRPLFVVNLFLVTSELTKACRWAVIIIHYSIILPQHNVLYSLNISWTNHRQDADINFGN